MQRFESIFSYHGVHRLSYFWANPNHAAAVLVALLPFFWAVRCNLDLSRRQIGAHSLIILMEVFWSFLIGWTFSRGAMVAWLVALVAFALAGRKEGHEQKRRMTVFWCLSLVVYSAVLLGTSAGARFADIAEGDRSALNRLGIWSNALQLIHAAPVTGWGAGESGNALLQWLEPVSSTKEFAEVVGTYLHFGAEFGMFALCGGLWVIIYTLLAGYGALKKSIGWRNNLLKGTLSGFVAFLVAAIFSTLWIEIRTSGVMVLLLAGIWCMAFKVASGMGRKSVLACVLAGGAGIIIFSAGWWFSVQAPYSVKKFAGGIRLHNNTNLSATQDVTLVVDTLVLGTYYGGPIRQMLGNAPGWREVAVYTTIPAKINKGRMLVIFGSRYTEFLDVLLADAVMVCPVGLVPEFGKGLPKKLILPEYDEFGFAPEWKNAFASKKGTVVFLKGVGQDCSSKAVQLVVILTESGVE